MSEIVVNSIPASEASPWLMARHYAKRMCPISYAFGAWRGSMLVGVVTFGMPSSPHLCRGLCGEEYSEKVLELNRLCCENSKNVASTLVGRSLRLLPKPSIVVSYADTAQGHVGYIYQATNFIYTGLTRQRNDRVELGVGHSRHAARLKGSDKIDTSKGEMVARSQKHRYVYLCGNKQQMTAMRSALRYAVEPYPKGESRRYDTSAPIETQTSFFG